MYECMKKAIDNALILSHILTNCIAVTLKYSYVIVSKWTKKRVGRRSKNQIAKKEQTFIFTFACIGKKRKENTIAQIEEKVF